MQGYGPSSPINPNQLIGGRYNLGRPLGRGTFGQVFEAEDVKFVPPKRVALKLLHPEFLNDNQVRDDIRREAGVLARFNHPNILRVIDFEVTRDLAYIVTDLAEGGSLADKIVAQENHVPRRLPLPQVARYLEQIAEALDEAHAQGLIHRDIKPLNILLDKWDRPLLADFGLAANLSATQSSMLLEATTSGTPLYMSPEQWHGQSGKASDIYALGVLVYQLVTGRTPYEGNQFELMGQHLNAPIPPLSLRAPDLKYPPALDTVIAGVMAKDQHQRLRPASEFARRFKAALTETAAAQPSPLISNPNSPPAPTEVPKPKSPAPAYAETQVVALPPHAGNVQRPANQPNQMFNASPPQPNNNFQPPSHSPFHNAPPRINNVQPPNPPVYATPQPPYQYNQNYNAPGPAPYLAPGVTPRKNYTGLYIGIGVGALVLVLLIVLIATNNGGNSNNSNTSNGGGNNSNGAVTTVVYPNASRLNVGASDKATCATTVINSISIGTTNGACNFYETADSSSEVLQFYRTRGQSNGLSVTSCTVQRNSSCLKIGNSRQSFVVLIYPPENALLLLNTTNTVFVIVDKA